MILPAWRKSCVVVIREFCWKRVTRFQRRQNFRRKLLERLGLHDLPIIGLAKEHEEIYRPGRALPLQLPMDSGALRLLQRIRDEAHRFANAYHQLLMKKRIGESILDDCPGVSQNRKNLLLRKFGSVKRLRKATVEEIASTEGIGRKLAEEVHRFLQRH